MTPPLFTLAFAAPMTLALDVPGLALLLLAGLALAWSAGVLFTLRTLSRPPRRTYAFAVSRSWPGTPEELPPAWGGPRAFTEFSERAAGVDLPVWDIPGDQPDGPVAVLTHGWGDSRVLMLPRLEPFLRRCARVIVWDLPRHGEAGPPPGPRTAFQLGRTEHALLRAVVDAATRDRPDAPVVLSGFSLGAGVSLAAAGQLAREAGDAHTHVHTPAHTHNAPARPALAGLLLEAPYRFADTPARRVMLAAGVPDLGTLAAAMTLLGLRWGEPFWWRATPANAFDRAAHARRLVDHAPNLPVLILHGEDDPICPPDDSEQIAAALRGQADHTAHAAAPARVSLTLVPNARHVDLWTNPQTRPIVVDAVDRWLAQLAPGGVAPATGAATPGPGPAPTPEA